MLRPLFTHMNKASIILFTLLYAFQCCGASSTNSQLFISPALLHFDYTEFSTTDEILDQELGWLGGIEIRFKHTIDSNWLINLNSSYYQGTVDYDGQTQTGIPHETDTKNRLFRIGARLEKTVYKDLRLFAGLLSHKWNRHIQDTSTVSGLSETYRWNEYSIGFNTNLLKLKKDTFNIEAAYLLIRKAKINVDLSSINFGSTTLDIGDGSGGRLVLNWKRISDASTSYGISLFYEAWDFARSNTKLTQGGLFNAFVTEPRSETKNYGLKFHLNYHY